MLGVRLQSRRTTLTASRLTRFLNVGCGGSRRRGLRPTRHNLDLDSGAKRERGNPDR